MDPKHIIHPKYPGYELELGPRIVHLTCECCGELVHRVWGFIKKDNTAHAVYYALICRHDEEDIRVGMTVSIGEWWHDPLDSSRQWLHLQIWPTEESFVTSVREPAESNYFPWEIGGKPLSREEALANPLVEEFFRVSDFACVADPAVNSVLCGMEVNQAFRHCMHKEVDAQ